MKRWFFASLALNTILIGIAVGYFFTSSLPLMPNIPPDMARHGIEADLQKAIEGLKGEGRAVGLEILDKNLAIQREGKPFVRPPRPEDMLAKFRGNILPEKSPFSPSEFRERHDERMDAVHRTFLELSHKLNQADRDQIADYILDRVSHIRSCLASDAAPVAR